MSLQELLEQSNGASKKKKPATNAGGLQGLLDASKSSASTAPSVPKLIQPEVVQPTIETTPEPIIVNEQEKSPFIKKVIDFDKKVGKAILPSVSSIALSLKINKAFNDVTKELLNTKAGKKVVSSVYKSTEDIGSKTQALASSAFDPEKTYKEAYRAIKLKEQDPTNTEAEQLAIGVKNAIPQTAVGIVLNFIPYVGKSLSTAYFASISAGSQVEESGEVTSPINIVIDTLGDRLLGNAVESILKSSTKDLADIGKKTFKDKVQKWAKDVGLGVVTEGVTEPSQTLLKYANSYREAKTEQEKTVIKDKLFNYIKSGDILREFGVAGITGGTIGGVTSAIPTKQGEPALATQEPSATQPKEEVPTPAQVENIARMVTERRVVEEQKAIAPTPVAVDELQAIKDKVDAGVSELTIVKEIQASQKVSIKEASDILQRAKTYTPEEIKQAPEPTKETKIPANIEEVKAAIAEGTTRYGSKDAYLASDEYKSIYPQIKPIIEDAKTAIQNKREENFKKTGLKIGDRVQRTAVQPFGGTKTFTGVVAKTKDGYVVKLDSPQMTSSGMRATVPLNENWKIEKAIEPEKKEKPKKEIKTVQEKKAVSENALTERDAMLEKMKTVNGYIEYYLDSHANPSLQGLKLFLDTNSPDNFSPEDVIARYKELHTDEQKEVKPKTQAEKVKEVIAEKPKTIKEIAKETKILEPNVRRILGVGEKEGTFTRVDKGVYILSRDGQDMAYIHAGDSVETLPRLAKEGLKADMIFLDIPYDTPAIKGGNRKRDYSLISVGDFEKVVDAVKEIAREENTPVIHMYSNAKSGMTAMQKYNDVLINKGFIPVGKGKYQKTYKDGTPVGFPARTGYMITEPEGILVFTQSGELNKELKSLDFTLVRPKGYDTEKPAEMLKAMIEMTTEEGDVVLDPFAGSGVTGAEAVKAGRKAVLIEKNKEVVETITKPRVEKAIESVSKEELDAFIAKGEKKKEVNETIINAYYDRYADKYRQKSSDPSYMAVAHSEVIKDIQENGYTYTQARDIALEISSRVMREAPLEAALEKYNENMQENSKLLVEEFWVTDNYALSIREIDEKEISTPNIPKDRSVLTMQQYASAGDLTLYNAFTPLGVFDVVFYSPGEVYFGDVEKAFLKHTGYEIPLSQEQAEGKLTLTVEPGAFENVPVYDTEGNLITESARSRAIKSPTDKVESDISLDLARQAYRGTSFYEEKRADTAIQEYQDTITSTYEDLKKLATTDEKQATLDGMFATFREGYKKRTIAILEAQSRVISPMISGAGNFPVQRNQKRIATEMKRIDERQDFYKRSISKIENTLNPKRFTGTTQDVIDQMEGKLAEMKASQAKMKEANRIIHSEKDIEYQLESLGYSAETISVLLTGDFSGQKGFPSYALTSVNNKIKTLQKRIEETKNKRTKAEDAGSEDITIGDVTVTKNYDQNRLQIIFPATPSEELRTKLKAKGFKWSPSNSAWQRILTTQAENDAVNILNEAQEGTAYFLPRGTELVSQDPILNTKRELIVRNVQGEKVLIPDGEAFTPYIRKDGKILLQDGIKVLVNKGTYETIKQNSKIALGKPFAPELDALEETIKADAENTFGIPSAMKAFDSGKDVYGIDDEGNESLIENREDIKNFTNFAFDKDFKVDVTPTKYQNYTLPGGEGYHEILIRVPEKLDIPVPAKEARKQLKAMGITFEKDMDGGIYPVKNDEYIEYDEQPVGIRKMLDVAMGNATDEESFMAIENDLYQSSHWDEKNVLTHLRAKKYNFNGERVYFVEEIQSDWAREGRSKGFATDKKLPINHEDLLPEGWKVKTDNGDTWYVYDEKGSKAPNKLGDGEAYGGTKDVAIGKAVGEPMLMGDFKSGIPYYPLLKSWQEIAIKKALIKAVESDAEYFAWINGEQTSARYNLATHVDEISWETKPVTYGGGTYTDIELVPKSGKNKIKIRFDRKDGIIGYSSHGDWTNKTLDEVLGKGLADKIMEKESGTLSGEGLKFGGEWADNLYNKQIKNIVEDLTGSKVEVLDMGLPVEREKTDIFIERLDRKGEYLKAKPDQKVEIGQQIHTGGTKRDVYIVTDVLGGGKFEAVAKSQLYPRSAVGTRLIEDGTYKPIDLGGQEYLIARDEFTKQTFDISQKTTTQQAIRLTPEVKAIIRGEAPTLKKPSDAAPLKIETVDNIKFNRTIEEIQQRLNEIFGKEVPIRTVIDPSKLGNKDALGAVIGRTINLLQENNSLSEVVANHEGWHWFKRNISKAQLDDVNLIEANFAQAFPEKVNALREKYTGLTEEQLAEEAMADEFASYYRTGKTFSEKVRLYFDRLLQSLKLLFKGRSDVIKMFKNVQKTIEKSTVLPEVTDEIKNFNKKPFNTGDENLDMALDLSVREENANIPDDSLGEAVIKGAPDNINTGNTAIELPQELQSKIMALEFAKERIQDMPGKYLIRFVSKKEGEFIDPSNPDLAKTQKQKLRIIERNAKLYRAAEKAFEGTPFYDQFDNSDVIKEAIEEYTTQRDWIKQTEKEVKDETKAYINAIKDQRALEKMAISSEKKQETDRKKAEEEKAKQMREEEKKRAFEEGVKKAREEQEKRQERIRAINRAYEEPAQKYGAFFNMKRGINPLKYVDLKTRNIVSQWNSRILQGKIKANNLFHTTKIPKGLGIDAILDYQAGKDFEGSREVKTTFDALYEEANNYGLNVEYRRNYLPQVYKENAKEIDEKIRQYLKDKGLKDNEVNAYMQGKDIPAEQARFLQISPSFTKERTFPDYKTAMAYGLIPRFTDIRQLVAHYKEEMDITVANLNLIDELLQSGKILLPEEAPRTWNPVNLPFSQKGYVASPNTAKLLNGLFPNVDDTKGFFHYSGKVMAGLQNIMLSAGVPYSTINFFAIGQANKELHAGNLKTSGKIFKANKGIGKSVEWFNQMYPTMLKMAEYNIDVTNTVGEYGYEKAKFFSDLKEAFIGKDIKGSLGIIEKEFDRAFGEKTFRAFMPMMHIQMFHDVYQSALKDGLPESLAGELAKETTQKIFGLAGFTGRSKFVEDVLKTFFFAPRFRESVVKTLANTGKAGIDIAKSMGGIKKPLDPTLEKNRRLLIGMLLSYALYNLLNKILNGHYLWDNPKNREFALQIPTQDGTLIYVEFMPSFLAFVRNMAEGGIATTKGDFQTAGQKFGSLFSVGIKIMSEIISNSDYFGNPIYKNTDTTAKKMEKIAIYLGLHVSHPYIAEIVKWQQDKKPLYQAIIAMLELPLKFSTKDKVATGLYYDALDRIEKERIKMTDKVRPKYDEIQLLKATGDINKANELYNALTPEEKEIYAKIKTTEKRYNTLDAERTIYETALEITNLKEEGKIEEATALYNTFSPEEKHAYQLLKDKGMLD